MPHARRLKLWVVAATTALVLFVPLLVAPRTAAAQQCPPGGGHTVQPGEHLTGIGARYGVAPAAIAQANGLANPNQIYAGQRLTIPGCGGAPAAPAAQASPNTPAAGTHVVQPGETLSSIAARYGVSEAAIAQANGLANPNLIYAGQQLVIPTAGSPAAPAPAQAAAPAPRTPPAGTGKRIEVDLTKQWMYAYEGNTLFLSSGVSTGRNGWETPAGNFAIYQKLPLQTMSGNVNGESWYVPNVPHVMYFFRNAAFHGTYWHNAFGTGARLSHGCVNLPLGVAEQLYNWAPVGTPVWAHY